MAIIDDYAGIAAELHRIRDQQMPKHEAIEPASGRSPPTQQHRMRVTPAGDELYRRLVSQRYRFAGTSRRR
jgi:hypothetical protein